MCWLFNFGCQQCIVGILFNYTCFRHFLVHFMVFWTLFSPLSPLPWPGPGADPPRGLREPAGGGAAGRAPRAAARALAAPHGSWRALVPGHGERDSACSRHSSQQVIKGNMLLSAVHVLAIEFLLSARLSVKKNVSYILSRVKKCLIPST